MFMETKELHHPLNKEPVASKPSAPRMYFSEVFSHSVV